MKFITFSISLLISIFGYSQIPLKSDIVYYKIQEEIESKDCIVEYFSYSSNKSSTKFIENLMKDITVYASDRNNENNKNIFKAVRGANQRQGFFSIQFMPNAKDLNCSTTVPLTFTARIPFKPGSSMRTYELLGLGKKTRISYTNVTFNSELLLEKNSFTLKIKGASVTIAGMKGMQGFQENNSLGEMYAQYLNDEDKVKGQDDWFNEVDKIVRDMVVVLKKRLEKSITLYELD